MDLLQNKQDYAAIIETISDELLGFVSSELPEECEKCVNDINGTVKNLLDFSKPKVMVYGIYNSGKSTLINALMKKEVAEMADRPMTDRISEFDHGDYVLVDSPGIDAPIQHEEVTNEFLNRCHIILFVISSKGGFEGKYNYEKMAELINRDIPFVIVLNERGYQIKKEWSLEEKALYKAEYEQELKSIQYKIIDNLKRVTGNQDITSKYEVYILNARKALLGIQKNNQKLYEASNIRVLDQRIIHLVQSSSVMQVLKQPITNLKVCFDYVEHCIAEQMQESGSENFAAKIEILRKKQENLKDEMRILIRQATNSRIEEITLLYVNDDGDAAESVKYAIFQDVEDKYVSKLTDLLVYIRRSFQDIDALSDMIDPDSNLIVDIKTKDGSQKKITIHKTALDDATPINEAERKSFWDIFKSQKQREKEKRARLEREADLINERNLNRLNETLRIRQEARQIATAEMFELQNMLITTVNEGIRDKFDDIVEYIQMIDCQNMELRSEGQRKLKELSEIRKKLMQLEDKLL